jgi:hypothetical protein
MQASCPLAVKSSALRSIGCFLLGRFCCWRISGTRFFNLARAGPFALFGVLKTLPCLVRGLGICLLALRPVPTTLHRTRPSPG